jgi:hypothetical protein
MSLGPDGSPEGEGPLSATRRRFGGAVLKRAVLKRAVRLAVCLGLAAALPLASSGVASAAPKGGHGAHGAPSGQAGSSGQSRRHAFTGTVSSPTTSGGFTLLSAKGVTLTVEVSSATVYREPGARSGAQPEVLAGDKVRVVGTEPTPGTLDATLVLVPLVRAAGTVASVGTGSFVLTLTASTLTVNVTSATVYREPTVHQASFANVLAGEKVAVTGTQAGTGTIDATTVMVRLEVRAGRVASLTAGGFTLTTAKGVSVIVNVSSSAKFKGPKGTSPSVSVGDQVRVIGTDGGPGTLNAVSVMVNASAGHGHHR